MLLHCRFVDVKEDDFFCMSVRRSVHFLVQCESLFVVTNLSQLFMGCLLVGSVLRIL